MELLGLDSSPPLGDATDPAADPAAVWSLPRASRGMGAQPCALRGTDGSSSDSQPSLILAGALLSQPQRCPVIPEGRVSPPIPASLNDSLSKQPNKIPAAPSWLELPPLSLGGGSMAVQDAPWFIRTFPGPGHPSHCPQVSQQPEHLGPPTPSQPWLSFKVIP